MNANAAQMKKLILENWYATIQDLSSAMGLSTESVHKWCWMQEPDFQHDRILTCASMRQIHQCAWWLWRKIITFS